MSPTVLTSPHPPYKIAVYLILYLQYGIHVVYDCTFGQKSALLSGALLAFVFE